MAVVREREREGDKINNDGWNESDRTNMNEREKGVFKGKGFLL